MYVFEEREREKFMDNISVCMYAYLARKKNVFVYVVIVFVWKEQKKANK